jgi:hypothetical protein
VRDKERASVVMFTNVDAAGSIMQTGGERMREREERAATTMRRVDITRKEPPRYPLSG